ncbi:hypothetical protein ERO13_D13G164700v2 [Gossypium hirsutum]|uniref:UPF0481 protein At3g47200-like n=2 Tax=Gossypium TaxID=3633 RepID=A0A1U8MGZ1_GOSHI|nr:UPF0481 protein At3g47200 [Gossypium hirsutum]XP_016726082.1 UPF0481 protein At3g47200 [Gossypium hirsutum]XP_016726088.1 UPF0481 protein At3g47200 [Gossypium hirsutum]KAB1995830.1 hypothetical protein ES319_D13G188200v1 [Gossypium barbadense]KAB1995831.1 hypothetical protein ES319_D13G188200v1 [Gossypium barbadense]KAG4112477.1 hypothetical protein ERO13_D13G164700v2 [Gossypium hirsutum]KAG4112478.1 hypothetical protein ERO13_D13G164700v2 [Gossypium hirsutum]PPD96368.1 hypothetical prote
MAPKKGQLGKINAPSFETKKDEASNDSEVEDLERGPDQGFIYEVPRNIRQANPKAYTPLSISIGPLHYRKTNLASMAKYKVGYQVKFLQRNSGSKEPLESFWSFIERNEKKILNYYEALIDEDEFVKMIFYDALFIVELFLRNYEKEVKNSDVKDFLLKETWSAGLRRDLILLENQIPMFVLEELYKPYENHKLASDASVPSFLKLTCSYFDIPWDPQFEHIEIPHFTALQRCHMTKTQNPSSETKIPTLKKVYGATSLQEVGVELIVEPNQTACLLDIKFEGKKLKIPKLTVHSNTEAYLRNVMAFEMCHCPDEAYVCAYIELMNYLIPTAQDVKPLIEKGILSKEGKHEGRLVTTISTDIMVQRTIKKLMQGIGEPPPCYRETANQLNQLYKEGRKRKVTLFIKKNYGILKRVYFPNLWRGTGTAAAFMVVIFTIIQTVLAFVKD